VVFRRGAQVPGAAGAAGLFYNAADPSITHRSEPAGATTTTATSLGRGSVVEHKIARNTRRHQTFDHYYAGNTTLQPDATLAYDAHPQ
jgi:hypothetical protein